MSQIHLPLECAKEDDRFLALKRLPFNALNSIFCSLFWHFLSMKGVQNVRTIWPGFEPQKNVKTKKGGTHYIHKHIAGGKAGPRLWYAFLAQTNTSLVSLHCFQRHTLLFLFAVLHFYPPRELQY